MGTPFIATEVKKSNIAEMMIVCMCFWGKGVHVVEHNAKNLIQQEQNLIAKCIKP